MRRVFADTTYWVAMLHRRDQWHGWAMEVSRRLAPISLVTTDEVFDEVLAHFSGFGPVFRAMVARAVRLAFANPNVEVIPQSRETFLAGLTLYEGRVDKEYSLTDCISMAAMRNRHIAEVLTRDAHFAQEGFVVLL